MIRINRFCASVILNYRGFDRNGLNKFGNGFGLRAGRLVIRFWWLSDNDFGDCRQ